MTIFLRTAFRVFKKDKIFTLINILGLTLGIMSSIVIFLVVKQEMSYDKFHEQLGRIYRVNNKSRQGNGFAFMTATPAPMAEALKQDIPAVEESTFTYYRRSGAFRVTVDGQEREFNESEGVVMVRPSFFSIFSFDILAGDVADLGVPGKVFLSESIAKKFFATNDPFATIGQPLQLDKEIALTVAGIVKDFPANTDFPFTIFISPETFKDKIDFTNWDSIDNSLNTYFLLQSNADTTGFKALLDTLIVKNSNPFFARFFSFELQPMSEVHFDSRYSNYNARTISGSTITGMVVLGAFLLLTACINFINLATANAIKRSKEVGIKKILGSPARQLIGQFLGETLVLAMISLAISLPLAYFAKPFVEDLIGFSFDFALFSDPAAIAFMVALVIFVVVVSGCYPALVMARFKPSQVIKGGLSGKSGGGNMLRKVLVVFQFLISQVLIIGLFVIFTQMDYFISKDLGFAREGVVVVPFPRDKHSKGPAFKGAIQNIPGVEMVSLANGSPTSRSRWVSSYSFDGADEGAAYMAELKFADRDYLDLYDLRLLAGRNFLDDDTVSEVIINRKMMEEMGYATPEEALKGKVTQQRSLPIVGVVENYHTTSLRDPIRPGYITTDPNSFREAGIKLNMAQSGQALAKIGQVWGEIFPNEPFSYQFLDETIRNFYEAEQRLTRVIGVFTGIAIFIGCLGLYGLVSFVVNQRQREIGIRKVLGADVFNIFYIISREFALLVLVAFVVAAPLAHYYAGEWLNGFEYRVDIKPFIFVVAVLISMLIAVLSVTFKALSAARINPVEVLRNE